MQTYQYLRLLSANERFGFIALILGGVGLAGTIWIPGAGPLQLLTLGLMVFGQLCYAQEAGMEKPLTKLILVALLFAGTGLISFVLDANPKAALLFAFAGFLSVLFWAVAMLHRPGPARAAGKLGVVAGGASLALLIGGHVFVGLGAAIGLGALRSIATADAADVVGLVQIVATCLGIWSLVGAWVTITGLLRQNA